MGIVFNQEIAQQMRLKLALNPFPTQEKLNCIRDETIKEYNVNFTSVHPELSLANQNINPTTITFEYDFLKPHFAEWKTIMAEKP